MIGFWEFAALIPVYLLGTLPSGVLVARAQGVDITSQGSGNVGATNVARVVGKKAGIIVLICDVLKGICGIAFAMICAGSPDFVAAAGVAVVAGHCFSLPPLLKGGKGVATAFGVICTLSLFAAVIGIAIFAAVLAASRIVSLASVVAALIIPIVALVSGRDDSVCFALAAVSLIVVFRHRSNIERLISGTEPVFSFGGKKEGTP